MNIRQVGFDIAARKITTVGPASSRVTFTSKRDIARSVAQLAILAMVSPASLHDSVPSHVHISGCTRSAGDIAQALSEALSRAGSTDAGMETKIEVVQEDLAEARRNLKEAYDTGDVGAPAGYIRFAWIDPFVITGVLISLMSQGIDG